MSIKKVASIAGVSIATVSRFFNSPNKVSEKTRQRVAGAIKQLNYSPNTLAQNLRRGKTGLVIAVVDKLSSPLYSSIIDHLSAYAAGKGYTLLSQQSIENTTHSPYDCENMVRNKQADGYILFTQFTEQNRAAHIDNKSVIALVCEIPQKKNNGNHLSVAIDDFKAADEATEYLIEQGHKKIAFIHCGKKSATIKQRHLGFLAAAQRHNISSFIEQRSTLNQDIPLQEKLHDLCHQEDRPTALFCADDDLAIETLHYLTKQSLKVPDDISLIGFNNSPYSALTDPPLTTIEAPTKDIAINAFDSLLSLMEGNAPSLSRTVVEHSLVKRESTKPLHD